MPTREPNQKVRITKTRVDQLTPPKAGQRFLRDTDIEGFAVRITANGAKAFTLERRINGRSRRVTLGRYPDLTAEQARREAEKQVGMIAAGKDPVAEREETRRQSITLAQAFHAFKNARKNLKPYTLYNYTRAMKVAFPDWQTKPLREITKDRVARRHTELGEARGHAYADLSMRVLRSVINFANAEFEDRDGNPLLPFNPVDRLSRTRAWYGTKPRQTVIELDQVPDWYQAVDSLRTEDANEPGTLVADYLTLLLFTGLRRQEGASLRWEFVDRVQRTLTIPETKNGEPLTLPIPGFIHELLERRWCQAINDWVFPGRFGLGHLKEPRPQMRKITAESGVSFTMHDLRRTFVTAAERLDISAYALKRLVNHKMHNDVTAGYIISDVERLRGPMDRIAASLVTAISG